MTLDVQAVLKFWFEELNPEDWFSGKSSVDDAIRERFLDQCRALMATAPADHLGSPREALAAIIVLDQFTRNAYRGDGEAFAGDPVALAICHGALARGHDQALSPDERRFLLMPLMHSEVLSDQELSVKLFSDLGGEESVKYAIDHRDVIARFGRFPHRNRALGRESTEAELAFLGEHPGYGQ